jgi:hypothetical protein
MFMATFAAAMRSRDMASDVPTESVQEQRSERAFVSFRFAIGKRKSRTKPAIASDSLGAGRPICSRRARLGLLATSEGQLHHTNNN